MIRPLALLAIIAAPLALRAQEPAMLPSGRTFLELREGERNPFGSQVSVEQPVEVEAAETEEFRLRRLISNIRVSGVSGAPGGYAALMGSLIVRPGDTFPPLLRGQSEVLKVTSVSPEAIVFSFVERDASVEARQIIVPVSVQPAVRQVLFGEAFEELAEIQRDGRSGLGDLSLKGVEDLLKASKESDLSNLTERNTELMGEVKNEAPAPQQP